MKSTVLSGAMTAASMFRQNAPRKQGMQVVYSRYRAMCRRVFRVGISIGSLARSARLMPINVVSMVLRHGDNVRKKRTTDRVEHSAPYNYTRHFRTTGFGSEP